MSTALLEPVLVGQKWVRSGGKHDGVKVRVLSANENTVTVKVLPSAGAKKWDKGNSGQMWHIGRHLFGTAYRLVRESGGGSVHDAPLPPAAHRSEMTIEDAVTEMTPVEPTEVVSNGIAEYGEPRAVPYEKICSSCGKIKVAEDHFYHSSASKDGFHTWCKVCQDANRKKNYLKNKYTTPEDRVAAVREAMGSEVVKAKVREGSRKKFESLTAEQKGEIIALWQAKMNAQEVQKAYGLNGAMYHMVLEEYRAAQELTKAPADWLTEKPEPEIVTVPIGVDRLAPTVKKHLGIGPAGKSYTVTYTVMRPVEVSEIVEASYMTEAIRVVGARDGVQEVTSVVLNKSEDK